MIPALTIAATLAGITDPTAQPGEASPAGDLFAKLMTGLPGQAGEEGAAPPTPQPGAVTLPTNVLHIRPSTAKPVAAAPDKDGETGSGEAESDQPELPPILASLLAGQAVAPATTPSVPTAETAIPEGEAKAGAVSLADPAISDGARPAVAGPTVASPTKPKADVPISSDAGIKALPPQISLPGEGRGPVLPSVPVDPGFRRGTNTEAAAVAPFLARTISAPTASSIGPDHHADREVAVPSLAASRPADALLAALLPHAAAAGEAASPTEGPVLDQVAQQLDLAHEGEWLDRLAKDIARTAGNEGSLRFKLNPENLGSLHVEVSQASAGASIRLIADTEAARAIIADAQPKLIAEARANGVRIAETHVDLGQNGTSQNGGQNAGHHSGNQSLAGDPRGNRSNGEPTYLTGNQPNDRNEENEPANGRDTDRYA